MEHLPGGVPKCSDAKYRYCESGIGFAAPEITQCSRGFAYARTLYFGVVSQ